MSTPLSANRAAIVEDGFLSSESLFVSFSFTRDALLAASEKYLEGLRTGTLKEMPYEVKTYVHELTHYLHYTTTPYGLFLQYCRVMQSQATENIISALVEANLPFKLPLLENLPAMPAAVHEYVNPFLSIWINIEFLIATLQSDTARRTELIETFLADGKRVEAGQAPRLPPLLDTRDIFFRMQGAIAEMIDRNNLGAQDRGNPIPMDPANFDHEALRRELDTPPTSGDFGMLRTQNMLDTLGANPAGVDAIVESAATIAEFWDSSITYDELVAWANEGVPSDIRIYRGCIADALKVIKTRSVPQFILSYMTLCELMFFAPMLPQHAPFRLKFPGLRQILPVFRWMDLMGTVGRVAPMVSREDCGRFITALCMQLKWVHPLQLIGAAISGPASVSNPLAMIYLTAQQWRRTSLGVFFGVNRFLFDPSPLAEEWRNWFNFVILDYADRTNYHRDKGFLETMTTRNLRMLGMRTLMLARTLEISAPYRGGPDEHQWMTDWLREHLRQRIGLDFAQLRFV